MASLREQAEAGLREIEEAIVQLLQQHPVGLGNAEIAEVLGLASKPHEQQRNRLSYSILTRLIEAGRVKKAGQDRSARYLLRLE